MWDDDAMKTLEVPLANPVGSPKPVSRRFLLQDSSTTHLKVTNLQAPPGAMFNTNQGFNLDPPILRDLWE
jgi:hypothetical protein